MNTNNFKVKGVYILSVLLGILQIFSSNAQQVPDTNFVYSIKKPVYQNGKGSLVLIDQAHNNFHTKNGGFSPFSKLIELDGYRVSSLNSTISNIKELNDCKILVIANALNNVNTNSWTLPTPSAFSKEEISIIKKWVKKGGSLFLIADHMPFAGAAYELGKVFGFEFVNGFAFTGERKWPPSVFVRNDKSLSESPIVTINKEYGELDSIATFTGSAFRAIKKSIPVLCFLKEHYSLQPDTAWRFNSKTPKQNLDGYLQGSVKKFGKGKVAVFGEAAMFTAQLVNSSVKVGFNSELAPYNAQFTLNLIHWLDGVKTIPSQK